MNNLSILRTLKIFNKYKTTSIISPGINKYKACKNLRLFRNRSGVSIEVSK